MIRDEADFEALFREHYAPLCRFVVRYTEDAAFAEEIVQDTLLTLWRDRAELRVHTSLRAYLYASARNRALNHLKRLGRQRAFEESQQAEPASAPPLQGDDLERAEVAEQVRVAVAALPPRVREVVDLRWGKQWSYAEIAEAMGIGQKAVEALVTRAKKELRQRLREIE
jgi:RNA polymerase sigma-70 factor, ECF subfamily